MSRRRRREDETEEPEEDNFLVMFTALSMILVAFMVILNSMAEIQKGKKKEAKKSISGTFGALMGTGFEEPETIISQKTKSQSKKQKDNISQMFRESDSFKNLEEQDEIKIRENPKGQLVLRFDGRVLFNPGGIHLSPTSYGLLDKVARVIDDIDIPIRIEGHASRAPATGERSNWFLSAARAHSAMRYLAEATNLSLDKISAAGYGSSRPPEKEDAKARRVEIVFLPPGSGGGK